MSASPKRVLLVGWDAADWKAIDPLADDGKLNTLKAFVEGGVRADLATLHPVFSPMLWTSVATGKRPYKHGILGFTEPTPDGTGVQPITNLSRKTKAVWNILQQNGLKSNVVGWWPSQPAEPISGVMVGNHFQTATGPPDQPWRMRPGTVHPARYAAELASLRVNPNELDPEMILPFIPLAAEIDQTKDQRLGSCAKILAEISSVHGAATWLMENTEWDFMAVYYDGIDHFGHGFMKYHPPQQTHISDRDFELYQHVITAAYGYHSFMLNRLIQLAGPDTVVILMSDHGFHPDHLRPRTLPAENAGPATEHRDFGILAINGPNIKKGATITGCNLLDIAPTILSILGLPIGEDMDGRPLVEIFDDPPEIAQLPSWDQVKGDDGCHPKGTRLSAHESREALQQLVELGYVDAPDEDVDKAVQDTNRELQFNLATAYMDADRFGDALPILEPIVDEAPDQYRFAVKLAFCYQALQRPGDMRRIVDGLVAQRQIDVTAARKQFAEFEKTIRERQDEAGELIPSPESETDQAPEEPLAKPSIDFAKLSQTEQRKWRDLIAKGTVQTEGLDYLSGCTCIAEGNGKQALTHFARVAKSRPTPDLFCRVGEAHLLNDDLTGAARAFEKAVALQPELPAGNYGLARTFLRQQRWQDAAISALDVIDMDYRFAAAHYVLAEALFQLEKIDEAKHAAECALTTNPNFPEAHELLAQIAVKDGEQATADQHRKAARNLRDNDPAAPTPAAPSTPDDNSTDEETYKALKLAGLAPFNVNRRPQTSRPVVTIVSGLPRSGTSMMMQMLAAGGLPLLTDGVREADDDNPKGYYELEAVKGTWHNQDWVKNAISKGVKVIAQLLPAMPKDFHYRVVFMNRDLDEIIASQNRMLNRKGSAGAQIADARLRTAFTQHLRRVHLTLAKRQQFECLVVNYHSVLETPLEQAKRINQFLGGTLNPQNMAAQISPKLYRQRQSRDSE